MYANVTHCQFLFTFHGDVECSEEIAVELSVTHKLSGFVAHDLSGLGWSPLEVSDETDRDATGDSEDAI